MGKSHSSEHLSAELRTSKPAQGSSPPSQQIVAAWPFARHNISSNLAGLGLKPGTPECLPQTQQKTSLLFDPSQQLKRQQHVYHLDNVDNFGVDIELHTTNQMVPSTRYAVLDAAGYFSVSARRSPAHSLSPGAISMKKPVDVSIEPKLGTTYRPQATVSDPSYDLKKACPVFNSPEDLFGERMLKGLALEKVIGFQTPVKQSRLKPKRGKFQLQEKPGTKFVLSDILSNLPCSKQKLRLRAKKELRAQKLTEAPQREVSSMSASESCGKQESSANLSCEQASESPVMAPRRLTRLQQRKLKTSVNNQSKSSSSSAGGRRVADQYHPGKPPKETVKQRQQQVRLGGTNAITKHRHLQRNLVKFQQNRQRHLGYLGGAPASTRGQVSTTNVIKGGTIGDMHLRAFEIHQASLTPRADGLWKMQKGHIYSQQQESSAPNMSPPGRSWQQQELEGRSPPSRQGAATNQMMISAQQSQQQLMTQQHNEPLRDESQGASSDERELFTIFSGLRVVTMAGQPSSNGFPTTTTTNQGVPTQQQERPYRWLPTQQMAQAASHPRLGSV